MEKVIEVLNRMEADGVIENYAIGGGIAAIYYLEPYQTDDIDVFVLPTVIRDSGLVSLEPIYNYLEQLGYHSVEDGVGVLIEDWPVQFLPASQSVQKEAVVHSENIPFGQSRTRIFSAEYLAAELLRSGREKDLSRVLMLFQSEQVDTGTFRDIIERHGLNDKWREFAKRHGLERS
jgi:hypothetical protein